jgi:hypothetical protein
MRWRFRHGPIGMQKQLSPARDNPWRRFPPSSLIAQVK